MKFSSVSVLKEKWPGCWVISCRFISPHGGTFEVETDLPPALAEEIVQKVCEYVGREDELEPPGDATQRSA